MDCGQALTASFVACRHLIFFWGDVYLCDSGVLFLGLAAFYSIIPSQERAPADFTRRSMSWLCHLVR